MRSARRLTIREREDIVRIQRDIQLINTGDHFPNALLANSLKFGNFTEEFGIPGIHQVSENVEFVVVVFRC